MGKLKNKAVKKLKNKVIRVENKTGQVGKVKPRTKEVEFNIPVKGKEDEKATISSQEKEKGVTAKDESFDGLTVDRH